MDDPRGPMPVGLRLGLAVDFHGVIVEHPPGPEGKKMTDSRWPAVPGAIEWLKEVSERYDVSIISARFSRPGREGVACVQAARDWLAAHGIPWDWMFKLGGPTRITFSAFVPTYVLRVDDRAWRFEGRFPTLEEIETFKPWNR